MSKSAFTPQTTVHEGRRESDDSSSRLSSSANHKDDEDDEKDCHGCTDTKTVRTYRTKNGPIHGRIDLCDDCVKIVRMRETTVRLE